MKQGSITEQLQVFGIITLAKTESSVASSVSLTYKAKSHGTSATFNKEQTSRLLNTDSINEKDTLFLETNLIMTSQRCYRI